MRVKIRFARYLRHNQTNTELKLWYLLRNRLLASHKFRRQHPIGPYIVDYCCMKKRLIIELDGGQHAAQIEKDGKRTQYLKSKGYRVLRFWDNEVLTQTKEVLETILAELEKPSPRPLPKGEGNKKENPSLQK